MCSYLVVEETPIVDVGMDLTARPFEVWRALSSPRHKVITILAVTMKVNFYFVFIILSSSARLT